MKRARRNHGAAFKAQVAFAAFKGDRTLAELATQLSVHPTQITEWKQHALAGPSMGLAARSPCRTRRISRSSTPRSGSWRWRMIF